MKITGAIFDLDGTLLNSMHIWADIGIKYLNACGKTPKDDLMEIIKNMSMLQVTDYLISEYGLKKTNEEIKNEINALIEGQYRDEVLPKAGVVQMLEKLHAHGVKMAVASATDKPLVEMALKRNGIYHFFTDVFTCATVGAGKDTPLIYEKALELLGTPKMETPVFEDALYAAHTAKNAGFTVVGIYDEFSANDWEEMTSFADFLITDYTDENCFFN
ncbi:MAG: HAD family phosphatase, partial [Oscillospiraceae bacterium]